MDIEDYKTICSVRLFSGLPEDLMQKIIGNRSVQSFDKGQLIFQQGDNAKCFYVILSGWVKIFRQMPAGKEAILHIFSSREIFAEMAMFDGQKYPASAQVVADARLLAINCEQFKKRLLEHPEIATRMLATSMIHLKQLVLEIEQLKGRNSTQRVASFLLDLCSIDSLSIDSLSIVVDLPYEKNLIATRLGMNPESFSRVLNKLRGDGVACVNNQIVISDMPRLRDIAMGTDD